MGSRGRRLVARTAVAVGAFALVGASPGVAQAATQYDGEATALRIEGLRLTLFPEGYGALPREFRPLVEAIKELQSEAPEEFRRDSLTIAVPDQVIGRAEYPGTDTQGEIPPNPLITAQAIEASSGKDKQTGNVVSEASVAGLSIGGGALMVDLIKSECVGDGENISLDAPQFELSSTEGFLKAKTGQPQNAQIRADAIGTSTFNQRDTDGSTYGEVTNLVINLNTNLTLAALNSLFDKTTQDIENAADEVVDDLQRTTRVDGQPAPPEPNDGVDQIQKQAGVPAEVGDAFEQLVEQTDQLPPEARNALNNLAHLDGTITIANAACAQQQVAERSAPSQPQQAAPAQPIANDTSEPPLADTGTPAGMVGMGLAGVLALVGAGFVLTRLRRGGA